MITAAIASSGENISGMINASKGDYAYTIIDIDNEFKPQVVDFIKAIENIIRVRVI